MRSIELNGERPIFLVGHGGIAAPLRYSNAEVAAKLHLGDDVAQEVERRIGTRWRCSVTDLETREQVVAASTMAFEASACALAAAGLPPAAVDCIISTGTILDHFCPSIAVRVLKLLEGRETALTFDLTGGCGTFGSAMFLAVQLLRAGVVETALVVAAEPLTRLLWMVRRRFEALLFGDGAAAMLLSTRHAAPLVVRRCVLDTVADLGGRRDEIMTVPVVGCGAPPPLLAHDDRVEAGMPDAGCPDAYRAIHDAKLAATWGAHYMAEAVASVTTGVDRTDLYLVPHQPSRVVLDAVRATLGLSADQVASINESHGNLSSASVPMAFAERFADGPARHRWSVLAPVGTGLTVGATLVENTSWCQRGRSVH